MCMQLEPWSPASLVATGQAQEASGQADAAADSYAAALALDSHCASALLRLGEGRLRFVCLTPGGGAL